MKLTTLCFFEDELTRDMLPVTAWNAPWELWLGTGSLRSVAARVFSNTEVLGARHGETIKIPGGTVLFVHARLLSVAALAQLTLEPNTVYMADKSIGAACVSLEKEWEGSPWEFLRENTNLHQQETALPLGRYFWEYVYANSQCIRDDAAHFPLGKQEGTVHPAATLVNPEHIFIAKGAVIAPGAVLDASNGPIIVDEKTTVGANAVLTGPIYLGKEVSVNPLALLRPDTTIADGSKVGGEISASVVLPYSNKQHHGYLGRSYVGSWCNIATGVETSTIKNTYSDVTAEVDGRKVNTGKHSLGSLIGDHVKLGTNAVLSPGTSVGAFSNLMGSAPFPQTVAPFSWYDARGRQTFDLDKAIEVAGRVLGRRNQTLTEAQRQLMSTLFASPSRSRES